MRTPVAHEVQVIATGARPGVDPSKRELFTEATSTVLVFEDGAVIILSAAVATGQLVFLTNQESKREIVAQVLRKRNFRPTSCYVELQFTEPAPGFWGIAFPEKPEAGKPDPHQTKTVKLVEEAEVTKEIRKKHSAPANADEVERLKREVEGLGEQRKSLTQVQASPSGVEAHYTQPGAIPSDPASVTTPVSSYSAPLPEAESTKAAGATEPHEKTGESDSSVNSEQHQTDATHPAGPSADPLPRASSIWTPALIAEERKARGRSRTLIVVLLVVLVIVSCGAFYMHWLPLPRFFSRDQEPQAQIARAPSPVSKAPTVHPAVPPPSPKTNAAADAPSAQPETSSTAQVNAAAAGAAPAQASSDSTKTEPPASEGGRYSSASTSDATDTPTPAVASAQHLQPHRESHQERGTTRSTISAASPETPGVIPPKLLHSVRPVPPPDAVRDFVTGNVKVDALVDTSGRVKSVSVLAGPESLRSAALEAVKQYKYAPATRNSTPVSAHVTVSVQFWFEP